MGATWDPQHLGVRRNASYLWTDWGLLKSRVLALVRLMIHFVKLKFVKLVMIDRFLVSVELRI